MAVGMIFYGTKKIKSELGHIITPAHFCFRFHFPMSSRRWCFTINNPTFHHEQLLQAIDCTYIVWGRERAPSTGTRHLQGFVIFDTVSSRFASFWIWCTYGLSYVACWKPFSSFVSNPLCGSICFFEIWTVIVNETANPVSSPSTSRYKVLRTCKCITWPFSSYDGCRHDILWHKKNQKWAGSHYYPSSLLFQVPFPDELPSLVFHHKQSNLPSWTTLASHRLYLYRMGTWTSSVNGNSTFARICHLWHR